MKECYAVFLGRIDYREALALQMEICEIKKRGHEADFLLLLEHPPTITLGRNGDWHHLLVSNETLAARGVARYDVDRGGDITFHGPGQLVGYPLLELGPPERDVHRFMRSLEQTLIRTLAAYGVVAERREKLTGVWTEHGKIGAMGVHISRWITRHGFALNVSTDLSYFDLIVPCGIEGKGITSILACTRRKVAVDEVAREYAVHFQGIFGRQVIWESETGLRARLNVAGSSGAGRLQGRGAKLEGLHGEGR